MVKSRLVTFAFILILVLGVLIENGDCQCQCVSAGLQLYFCGNNALHGAGCQRNALYRCPFGSQLHNAEFVKTCTSPFGCVGNFGKGDYCYEDGKPPTFKKNI